MFGACAEIAGAHASRAAQHVGQRQDDLRTQQIERDEHDDNDGEERDALDHTQDLDAPFEVVLEQVDQTIDIEHEAVHAIDESPLRGGAGGGCACDRRLEFLRPGGGDALVSAPCGVVVVGRHAVGELRVAQPRLELVD